ncbi:MAG: hypothetical protein JKY77_09510 [Rhizobiaceae bacterium]|nr:hypothetical protein [Rhizobiaceae bacterium]
MGWPSGFRLIALCILASGLGGCASTIKTYDSTFTSATASNDQTFGTPKLYSAATSHAPTLTEGLQNSEHDRLYFIEFRARNALTYGHAAVVFGRLDEEGEVPVDANGVLIPNMVEISGLHPATPSSVPWSIGHIVPVPAETGPSDGDFEDLYVSARFRLNLTKKQFRKVVSIVHKQKELNKVWYAPIFALNCLGYISSIAKKLHLRVPKEILLPKDYVNRLKSLNT